MDIDLGYTGAIWVMDILTTTDPDLAPGCHLFNFFFTQPIFFGLIGLLCKLIVRTINRS